jgi:DNA-binding NarL/FixJ family response regulator
MVQLHPSPTPYGAHLREVNGTNPTRQAAGAAMRLLLVDRDMAVARPFLGLRSYGAKVSVVGTLEEASRSLAAPVEADLLVTGSGQLGADAQATIARLRRANPDVRLVVVSQGTFTRREEIADLLRAGAVGVVPDSMTGAALNAAMKLIMTGERFVPPEMLVSLDQPIGDAVPAVPSVPLSRRERQVAALLAQGLANKEIAWRLQLQEVTVKVYATSIYRKLGVRNRTQAAARLLALGWS